MSGITTKTIDDASIMMADAVKGLNLLEEQQNALFHLIGLTSVHLKLQLRQTLALEAIAKSDAKSRNILNG